MFLRFRIISFGGKQLPVYHLYLSHFSENIYIFRNIIV